MRTILFIILSLFPVPVREVYSEGEYTCRKVESGVSFLMDETVPAEAALTAYPELSCFGIPAEIPEAGYTQVIFWEDVLHPGSTFSPNPLPDNVVIQWWNYRGYGDFALREALANGYELICSPNYFTYLNFPTEPWKGYEENRTFSFEDAWLHNPVEKGLSSGNPLVLGGECALWTDYGLTEDMLDERLFPRIYAIAQLFWSGVSR